jgi:hypothetical protein
MKATIKQAANNERNLSVLKTGYGHYRISCDYRGKRISTVTTDAHSVDEWRNDPTDRDRWGYPVLRGYRTLCAEIVRANKDRN